MLANLSLAFSAAQKACPAFLNDAKSPRSFPTFFFQLVEGTLVPGPGLNSDPCSGILTIGPPGKSQPLKFTIMYL